MSNKKDGGPAYPRKRTPRDSKGYEQPQEWDIGMSLRDYFAAKAMSGILHEWKEFVRAAGTDGSLSERIDYLGRRSYEIADDMLKAREQ